MFFKMNVFTDEQLEEIHEQTMDLLESRGIAIHHVPSKKLLTARGAAAGEGDIVKIPQSLMEENLKLAPNKFMIKARNRKNNIIIGEGKTALAPAGGPVFVHDYKGGRRKGALHDVVNFYKLAQTSSHIGVVCAGILDPADVKEEHKYLVLMDRLIRNCDKPYIGFSAGESVARQCIEMARIAVNPDPGDCFVMGIVNTLSPMAWDERMLEAVWAYAQNRQPVVVACCSMAGFTSPTSLWATLVQNNAEILTGILIAQLVNPGTPVVYGNTSTITDMKTMNLCIGAPEYILLMTAAGQLACYYGVPFRSGGGLTDAKEVDIQAGIEAASNLFATFANKVDLVLHGMGILESFLTVSYEKWIWDEEIAGRIMRLFESISTMNREETVSLIGDTGPGGHYLDHPNTIDNFRKEFFTPVISDRTNWSAWQEKHRCSVKRAWEIWQERIKDFKAPELPDHVSKALTEFLKGKGK